MIRHNIERNFNSKKIDKDVCIMGFDWDDVDLFINCLLEERLGIDYIFASDVFYDPCVFVFLTNALQKLFNYFPMMEFYFSYQIRDSNWTIEKSMKDKGMESVLIRSLDIKQHTICLGKITKARLIIMDEKKMNLPIRYIAGIEGGSTHSTLVLIDSRGIKIDEWHDGPGLNCLLNGVERTADQIAKWTKESILKKHNLKLPLSSIGMGLSGAEDESTNCRMLEYFKAKHRDLAEFVFLTSDSIAAVATSFENGGVVLIAGTGSTCRLLKANGDVYGVGGWGHLIGDGSSAFWITMRGIKHIFDVEDGSVLDEQTDLTLESEKIATVKKELLRHFNVTNKLELLDILYNPHFNKPFIATFCKQIAILAEKGDNFALELLNDAGHAIAQHLCTISRHFDDEMFEDVPIVLIGSVFKSWKLMRSGFEKCLQKHNKIMNTQKQIRNVTFYQLECSPAIGAAILSAKFLGDDLNPLMKLQSRNFFDKLNINID